MTWSTRAGRWRWRRGCCERTETEADMAAELRVSPVTARGWIRALVGEGVLVRREGPVRYERPAPEDLQPSLFAGPART